MVKKRKPKSLYISSKITPIAAIIDTQTTMQPYAVCLPGNYNYIKKKSDLKKMSKWFLKAGEWIAEANKNSKV